MGNKVSTPRISSWYHPKIPPLLDEESDKTISDNFFKLANESPLKAWSTGNSKILKVYDQSKFYLEDLNWCILKITYTPNIQIRKSAEFEANLLYKLEHPNIVKSHKFFKSDNYIYVAMEHCSKGTLRQILNRHLSEEVIWNYIHQICSGIKYLHSNGIIHCDIKPENIFVCEKDELKIGDFGLSRAVPTLDALASGSPGTENYFLPEMEKGWYNSKRDIWALGVILYELCDPSGMEKASKNYFLSLRRRLTSKNYFLSLRRRLTSKGHSRNLIKVIEDCLKKNYEERPTILKLMDSDAYKKGTGNQNTADLHIKNPSCFIGFEEYKTDSNANIPSSIYYLQPKSCTVFKYNPQFGTIQMKNSSKNWNRFGSWCVIDSGEVIFSGGEDEGTTGSTYKFSFEDNAADIQLDALGGCIPISNHSLVCYRNYVYSIGGASQVIQRFDLKNSGWDNLKLKIDKIGITTACIAQEEIIFTGQDTDKFFSLDLETNKVSLYGDKELKIEAKHCKLLVQGGSYIYCLSRKSLYRSDLRTKEWEIVQTIEVYEWWSPSQALFFNGSIYFVTYYRESPIIWKLDCAENTVTSVANFTELTN